MSELIPNNQNSLERIKDNIESTVKKSQARLIFNTVKEQLNEKVSKFGVSVIMDSSMLMDCEWVGQEEGEIISEGEIRFIADSILNSSIPESNKIKLNGELNETAISDAVSRLGSHGVENLVFLTNTHDVLLFWHTSNFKSARSSDKLEGYYYGIPVYWNRVITKGITLLIDKNFVGKLIIKRDIKAEIKSIQNSEKESLLKALPELVSSDLSKKVRLYADELIKFDVTDPSSVIVIESVTE